MIAVYPPRSQTQLQPAPVWRQLLALFPNSSNKRSRRGRLWSLLLCVFSRESRRPSIEREQSHCWWFMEPRNVRWWQLLRSHLGFITPLSSFLWLIKKINLSWAIGVGVRERNQRILRKGNGKDSLSYWREMEKAEAWVASFWCSLTTDRTLFSVAGLQFSRLVRVDRAEN